MDKTGQIYSERRFKKVLMCHHNLLWHIVTVREQLSVTVIILFLCSDCRGVFFSTTKYTFSSFFPFKKKEKKNQMMIRLSVSSSGAPFSFTAHGRMTPTRRERAALIGVVCSRSSFANETTVKMKRDLASRKWLDTQLTNQSAAQPAACSHQTLGALQTKWLWSNRFRRRLRLKMVENPNSRIAVCLILFCAKVPNQAHFYFKIVFTL